MLDHTKKRYSTSRAKEKPQQDGRKGKIMFGIKPHTRQRHWEGTNKTLVCTRTRGRTRDWARPAFECVSVSCKVWISRGRRADRGSGCSRAGRSSAWPNSSWRKLPLAPPQSCWADDPQTGKQLYQRSSCTVVKVLGPSRFPNLGIWQRDWEPPGNLTLKASGIWIQNFHRTGETDSQRTQTKPCAHQDPGERSSDPTRDWVRLACECPEVPGGRVRWQSGALNTTVLGTAGCWPKSFWRWFPLAVFQLLLPQFDLRSNYWEGTQPHPSAENWIKDILSMSHVGPCLAGPPKTDGSWQRVLTKCGPLEKGNGEPLQHSCLENHMNSMKR